MAALRVTNWCSQHNHFVSLPQCLNGCSSSSHGIHSKQPNFLILIIDFLPRRDLVLHPDYLDEFYQQTNLDKQRQELTKLPQVQPYYSPSLYFRSTLSPTAIAVNIKCGDGQGAIEDLMRGQLASICKEAVRIWLDTCASRTKQPEETEIAELIRRDRMIKSKAIEVDLAANMPRMFTPEVAERVVEEIQKVFKVSDNYKD